MVYPIPVMQSAVLAPDNRYIDITFDEPMFSNNDGTGAPAEGNFLFSFNPYSHQGNTATTAVIQAVTKIDGSPLIGGEDAVRLHLSFLGMPT